MEQIVSSKLGILSKQAPPLDFCFSFIFVYFYFLFLMMPPETVSIFEHNLLTLIVLNNAEYFYHCLLSCSLWVVINS